MINYKLRLFTPYSSYGAEEMTQNRNYAHVHFRIQSDTKRFEYAACGRENFRIRKKIFAEKKFPDTCGHSLNNIVHTTAKGQLNLRKTPRCLGQRTCWQPLLVFSHPRKQRWSKAVVSLLDLLKQRLQLHNIELDIRGARDTEIEIMNCSRDEVISIASMI